jgi:DNA replication and repair protein RecF
MTPLVESWYSRLAGSGAVEITVRQTGDSLPDELTVARRIDTAKGTTSVGPHRDRIILTLDGEDSRTNASAGEQRTMLLAWTLAEVDLLVEKHGKFAALLLDEPYAELDSARTARLTELLAERDHSTFLTATEPIAGLSHAVQEIEIVNDRHTAIG